MTRLTRHAVVLVLALSLCACGEVVLHQNLNQIDADKILVLLDKNGIEAHTEAGTDGQETTWSVLVSKSDVSMARRLLVENNLPARPELGLSGVYSEKGLIPTPDEQRARFLLAMKGEVVNALRKIPGVHEVGVVLNVPQESELALGQIDQVKPSASVVLRVADPAMLHQELTEEKVKRFVANSIKNLEPNNVIVIISSEKKDTTQLGGTVSAPGALPPPPRNPPPPSPEGGPSSDLGSESGTAGGEIVTVAGIELDAASVGKFRFYLIIFLCVLILLSAALLLTLFRFSRMRRKAKPRRLEAVPIEGQQGGPDLLQSGQGAMGVGPGPGETGTGA